MRIFGSPVMCLTKRGVIGKRNRRNWYLSAIAMVCLSITYCGTLVFIPERGSRSITDWEKLYWSEVCLHLGPDLQLYLEQPPTGRAYSHKNQFCINLEEKHNSKHLMPMWKGPWPCIERMNLRRRPGQLSSEIQGWQKHAEFVQGEWFIDRKRVQRWQLKRYIDTERLPYDFQSEGNVTSVAMIQSER